MKISPFLIALVSATVCATALAEDTVYDPSIRCIGGPYGLQLPTDAATIRSMGKLLREEVAEVEQWEGYTATRTTLYFDGLELGVIELSNDPLALMVTRAVVTNAKWNRIMPFKIRQPVSAARRLLGKSAKDDAGLRKIYGGDVDAVQFHTASGLVTGVSYSCYSG